MSSMCSRDLQGRERIISMPGLSSRNVSEYERSHGLCGMPSGDSVQLTPRDNIC